MNVHSLVRPTWSDPAVLRAVLVAAIVVLLVILPIVFGGQVLGTPSFDVTPDPLGPLPF